MHQRMQILYQKAQNVKNKAEKLKLKKKKQKQKQKKVRLDKQYPATSNKQCEMMYPIPIDF